MFGNMTVPEEFHVTGILTPPPTRVAQDVPGRSSHGGTQERLQAHTQTQTDTNSNANKNKNKKTPTQTQAGRSRALVAWGHARALARGGAQRLATPVHPTLPQ